MAKISGENIIEHTHLLARREIKIILGAAVASSVLWLALCLIDNAGEYIDRNGMLCGAGYASLSVWLYACVVRAVLERDSAIFLVLLMSAKLILFSTVILWLAQAQGITVWSTVGGFFLLIPGIMATHLK